MKILALGPQNVYPPVDGGKEGVYGALCALTRLCDLTYAFPAGAEDADVSGYTQAGVRALAVGWTPTEDVALMLSATARLRPFKFEKYATPAAVAAYAARLRGQKFDAIICFHAHTWRLADQLRAQLGLDVPILVREHNIEYEIVASYRTLLKPAARLATWPVEALTRREERVIWQSAESVAFLSDHDLNVAKGTGLPGRFVLAREGVPIPAERNAKPPGPKAPLLVMLNPNAPQGVANFRDFLLKYWTMAVADPRLEGIALHVTGATTEKLANLVGFDQDRLHAMRVQGLGFLDSLTPCFVNSMALLSPTFTGGGIRKKILEAMANQLPVIATQLDIDSSSYFQAEENLLVLGGDVETFVSSVARLRSDDLLWQRLSDAGRSTVEQFASWEQFAVAIMEELQTLVGAARAHARAA